MRFGPQRSWSSSRAATCDQAARLSLRPASVYVRSSRCDGGSMMLAWLAGATHGTPACTLTSRPLHLDCRRDTRHPSQLPRPQHWPRAFLVACGANEQFGIGEQPSKAWNLQDLLAGSGEDAGSAQHQHDAAPTAPHPASGNPANNEQHSSNIDILSQAARGDQQRQQNPSTSAADGFPAQQWSQDQQDKQRYRQQQWQLWNARQQQLDRNQRLQAWQQVQQQQGSEDTAGFGGSSPYNYDESRWQVRSKDWRAGPPPR